MYVREVVVAVFVRSADLGEVYEVLSMHMEMDFAEMLADDAWRLDSSGVCHDRSLIGDLVVVHPNAPSQLFRTRHPYIVHQLQRRSLDLPKLPQPDVGPLQEESLRSPVHTLLGSP